ncbi:hypothetical protein NIES4075_67830 [Tolypothrix sp. NIES-4075]|uniref:NACHT domain-containing protein n=1 Tax=Tolypothrix sp. NIES-4075 TaxID=2005459 RepID=UPI000B5CDB5B|nr:NACHT domain-containing protein [Tolypothrix sp. NIES-4075]GAX45762.1 hypothetical protein NIES4075_67830 [Tolypothrix sp. NIES-4075]
MPESEDPKKVSNNDLRNAQFGGGFINAENVNAQRIGGDIRNFFFGQQMASASNPARPKNERILLSAVKEEVTVRLRQSLHNAVLINLGKESQPQQVKRPWDAEIKIGLKPAEPLPDTTTILSVFESEEIAGKLLILGAPGAGKTTIQLELARALVKRAEEQPDYPVPVLFNLSSWKDDRQLITKWLVTELSLKYGFSFEIGKKWIEQRIILPLLDGLDELKPQHQEPCVRAINKLLQGKCRPQFIVVCSRREEYASYETRLQLNGAICLQPLTYFQLQAYFADINHIHFWRAIRNHSALIEIVSTPLFLSIAILAEQELSLEKWQQQNSTTHRLHYLLAAYVQRMLTREIKSVVYRKQKSPTNGQTKCWLIYLAHQLYRDSQSEFLIENMQPSWLLTDGNKWIYSLVDLLLGWLVTGLVIVFAIVFAIASPQNYPFTTVEFLKDYLFITVYFGIFGIVFALMCKFCGRLYRYDALADEIRLFRGRQWYLSWKSYNNNFILGSLFGACLGIMIGAYCLFFYSFNLALISMLLSVFISGMFCGLCFGLSSLPIEKTIAPNQGVRESVFNIGIITLSIILSGGLLGGIIGQQIEGAKIGLWLGLMLGLIVGRFLGITVVSRHFSLRFILCCKGYIPWNYARFLNYCTERLFLQRVGGRYRFIHKLLQDHFAQMPFDRIID